MQIDHKLISYLEDLSSLSIQEGQLPKLMEDFDKILNMMTQLSDLDTDGVLPQSHCFNNVNAFRPDTPHSSIPRDTMLQNAPCGDKEMFSAPGTFSH